MSYRKKHYPAKPERTAQTVIEMEYSNPGVVRTLLTSGLWTKRRWTASSGSGMTAFWSP